MVGDTKYLALYEISHPRYLESLLGPDPAKRDPRANAEREMFDALRGLSDHRSNVYVQISGAHFRHPLLQADVPLRVVMLDCTAPDKEDEFNAWYDHCHVPNLTQIPGYRSGARFKLLDHPSIVGRSHGPNYLALYELENLACIPSLSNVEEMGPEAAAELAQWQAYGLPMAGEMSWNVYRPIATHYAFMS